MNGTSAAGKPQVVVVGGGFGALEAAFNLRRRVRDKARITVIADEEKFLFRPNLIYVPFGKDPEELQFPLRQAIEGKGIAFVHDRVDAVAAQENNISTAGGREIAYDHLILATGARMVPAEIPGLSEHANTIWSPEETLKLRESFARLAGDARQGHSRKVVFLVPPNNKCSGPLYEMVMMLDSWLRRDRKGVRDNVEIVFETFEPEFLMVFGPRLHEVVSSEFAERGITGHNRRVVQRVEPGEVIFTDDGRQSFDLLVTFPPYRASTQFDTLPVDDRGFIKVDAETRRVEGYANLYAVGDTGDFPVKQAFLALLQADTASEQVAAAVLGTKPELPFDPVSMCIMEQFDKATFANVPLELTGDPGRPVRVREGAQGQYKVGSGGIWRIGKMMLGLVLPFRFRHGAPFHAGPVWKVMELGLNVMRGLFAR